MSKYRKSEIEGLAAMFKALSNPQRLRIFLQLRSCCPPGDRWETTLEGVPRCAGELGSDLGIAASTVSHHLKELRQAGLMQVERCGKKIECWLRKDSFERLAAFFGPDGDARCACFRKGGRK